MLKHTAAPLQKIAVLVDRLFCRREGEQDRVISPSFSQETKLSDGCLKMRIVCAMAVVVAEWMQGHLALWRGAVFLMTGCVDF